MVQCCHVARITNYQRLTASMSVSPSRENREDHYAYETSAGRVKFTGVTPGGGTLDERFALLLPPIS